MVVIIQTLQVILEDQEVVLAAQVILDRLPVLLEHSLHSQIQEQHNTDFQAEVILEQDRVITVLAQAVAVVLAVLAVMA